MLLLLYFQLFASYLSLNHLVDVIGLEKAHNFQRHLQRNGNEIVVENEEGECVPGPAEGIMVPKFKVPMVV